jgi:hypothetical protein
LVCGLVVRVIGWNTKDREDLLFVWNLALELKGGLTGLLAQPLKDVGCLGRNDQFRERA